MCYPTIDIGKKKVILLSGFERLLGADPPLAITAETQLEAATERDSDAVAFGYVAGRWVSAAYMRLDAADAGAIGSKRSPVRLRRVMKQKPILQADKQSLERTLRRPA